MLGLVYLAMSYVEQVKLCHSCLIKKDIKIRSLDNSRKDIVSI